MQSRMEPFVNDKPKWEWMKVQALFSTKIQEKIQTFSLNSTTIFQIKIDEHETKKLKVKLVIDTERSPSYSPEIGWSWHKSRIFPSISLKIDLEDEQTSNLYTVPEKLKASIFAAKAVANTYEEKESSYFQDVGIVGQNSTQINQGFGILDGIRFETTSYINEGVKLHLIIILSIPNQKSSIGNIVASVVSSPMFIDSRKFARQYHVTQRYIQEKKLLSFFQAFEPKSFSKNYIKSRDQSQNSNNKIQNNIMGLYNYLTATNIRHKIKHPLYLAIKFSNAFQLLFNSARQKQNSLEQVLFDLQNVLVNQIDMKKKSGKRERRGKKLFLISINGVCNNYIKTKIYQCLEPLNCHSIEVIKYGSIQQFYRNVNQLGHLVQTYTKNYKKLSQIVKQQNQQSEKEIQQQQSEEPSKKMEQNEKNPDKQQQELCKFENIEQSNEKIQEYKKKVYKRKKPLFSNEERKQRDKIANYTTDKQKYLKLLQEAEQMNERRCIISMIKTNQQKTMNCLGEINYLQSQTSKALHQNTRGCDQFEYFIGNLKYESNMLKMNLLNQIDIQNKYMLMLINNNLQIKNEISKNVSPPINRNSAMLNEDIQKQFLP